MKVVIDCNILISAGLKDGICRSLVLKVLNNDQIFFSEEIATEYNEVMLRPHFKPIKEIQKIIYNILSVGILVTPLPCPYKLPDPDDEIYLTTALTAKTNLLLTGNKKHFPLDQYEDVKIINPRQFIDQFYS
jgi:putative PIN family toxin of toxin-antitoxin system